MNKLTTRMAVGLAAATGLTAMVATITPGSAIASTRTAAATATTTTTLGPPAQGAGTHKVFLYVDTVTGAGSNPKPAAGCAQTNLFQRGQVVVFRMTGVNAAAGGVDLTSANVVNAYVKVPGLPRLPLAYGTHGTASYWTAAWTISATYPLGIVNFLVHVATAPVPPQQGTSGVPEEGGTFTQQGLAPPSQLTVVAS